MSFLSGRMAATEGAFFREQSKAAKLLKEKMEPQKLATQSSSLASNTDAHADTLPEILMHSPPATPPPLSPPMTATKLPPSPVPEGSSLAGFSQSIMKQVTKGDGPQPSFSKLSRNDPIDLLSPSIPSVSTFGPRRNASEELKLLESLPSAKGVATSAVLRRRGEASRL